MDHGHHVRNTVVGRVAHVLCQAHPRYESYSKSNVPTELRYYILSVYGTIATTGVERTPLSSGSNRSRQHTIVLVSGNS